LNRGASGVTQKLKKSSLRGERLRRASSQGRIAGGKPRGGGHASIDSGEGKLAIGAANQQRGLAATLGSQ
jgi:hypothetical protein